MPWRNRDARSQVSGRSVPDWSNGSYWHLADIAAQPPDVRYWG